MGNHQLLTIVRTDNTTTKYVTCSDTTVTQGEAWNIAYYWLCDKEKQ